MEEIIDILYDKILARKCILVMGPDLVAGEKHEGFFEQFIEHLSKSEKESNKEAAKLYNEDGFFSLQDQLKHDAIKKELTDFYNILSGEKLGLYEQIAQIPFHLIFQVSPDLTLQKAFEKLEVEYQFQSYNARKPTERWGIKNSMGDEDPTLIINLILDYDLKKKIQEDVMLSYEDFFSFISYFYGSNPLPNPVLYSIEEATHILFLGYRFDKWYWKIIFDLFNYPEPKHTGQRNKKNKTNLIILGKPAEGNSDISSAVPGARSYSDNYQSIFKAVSIPEFIGGLHEKFKTEQRLRDVRKPGQQGISPIQKLIRDITTLARNSDTRGAFSLLEQLEADNGIDTVDRVTITKMFADYSSEKNAARDLFTSRVAGRDFDEAMGIPVEKVKDFNYRIITLMIDFKDRYS